MSLSDRYNHKDVEEKNYAFWLENNYFKAEDQSSKPPFSIILPPPNVTGSLHMGHALDHTIQDVLVRWKRMSGFNTMWLPGTDHAGIATQMVVEKQLMKDGKTRHDLGREKFLEEVWKWKEQYGARILEQMKKLGDSVDWDRHIFTMDEGVSKAVRKVFVQLHKEGLIYRGNRLVNWDTHLESAVSDLEVEHEERKGSMWHIKYEIEGADEALVIATTRPETLLGDSAICVHPEDERYQKYIGKNAILPLTGRKIPIIADEYVEREFGSGALKVTPAHDFNDYEIGKRHHLAFINILNPNGTLNKNAGPYKGLKMQEARKQILQDLTEKEILIKEEPYKVMVPLSDRTNQVIEPYLSDQWFIDIKRLAEPAKNAVENGTVNFEPASWTKTYLHWMNNIQDWCISRQLWWGHRIPAWYCADCKHTMVSETEVTSCEECKSSNLNQDEDVLDTWFSSGLWPFTTMGWPEETETLKTFYPTNVMVTGHDIIFFWVARMMMNGIKFMEDVPFRTVYIHGLIRDSQGKKMSKSIGNTIDPLDLIEQYGADALRFTLMSQIASGRDLKFSEQRLEGYRNFMNKIWNATRFALANLEDATDLNEEAPSKANLSLPDHWITHRLAVTMDAVDKAMESYRFSDAASSLYSFVWNDFCDWYLEFTKPILYGDKTEQRAATQKVLAVTLNRIMRLLHPFIPFISEEIYQILPLKKEAAAIDTYPTTKNDSNWLSLLNPESAQQLEIVKQTIGAIRNIRGENLISPAKHIEVRIDPGSAKVQKILGENKSYIEKLANVSECLIADKPASSKCAVTLVQVEGEEIQVMVPLEGLVDLNEEIGRIQKNIEKTEKQIMILSKKLKNENFVKNAPKEVVESEKGALSTLQSQMDNLKTSLQRLQ